VPLDLGNEIGQAQQDVDCGEAEAEGSVAVAGLLVKK
jgi:hypothetical protein